MAVIKKKSVVTLKKPKKGSLKKIQKTKDIKEAKQLQKKLAKKAISEKLNRPQVIKKQKSKHRFDPLKLKRGIVLIKNLPHGFFEPQLKDYFSQYGKVTRLRLARSEETGRSKAHAYVEFKYPEVAEIAAKTMDNYLMFRQIIKTVYIPPDKQQYDYFRQPVNFQKLKDGSEKLQTPKVQRVEKQIKEYNRDISNKEHADRVNRSKKKLEISQKKLAKLGINLDMSQVIYNPSGDKVLNASAGKGKKENLAKKKTDKKPETNKKPEKKPNKIKNKVTKKSQTKEKQESNPNNGTLDILLNETIPSSDEDSDDDEYVPSAAELEKAKKATEKLLQKLRAQAAKDDDDDSSSDDSEDDDEDVDALDSEDDDEDVDSDQDSEFEDESLSDEDSSDEEIGDADPAITKREAAKRVALAAAAKLTKSKNSNKKPSANESLESVDDENNDTLTEFMNDTIESDEEDSEDDDDYEPSQQEIVAVLDELKKQNAKTKQSVGQKRKNTLPLVAPKKVQTKHAFQVSDKTPEKRNANQRNKKQKLSTVNVNTARKTVSDVEQTPKKKPRTNFVTAPTPESTQKKAKITNKEKLSVAQKSNGNQKNKNLGNLNKAVTNGVGKVKTKQIKKGGKGNKK